MSQQFLAFFPVSDILFYICMLFSLENIPSLVPDLQLDHKVAHNRQGREQEGKYADTWVKSSTIWKNMAFGPAPSLSNEGKHG